MRGRASPVAAPQLLSLTAVEHGTTGGAEITPVMGHAAGGALNVRDVLVAEPQRVGLAGGALLRRPLLRSRERNCKCQRKSKHRRSVPEPAHCRSCGVHSHQRSSRLLSSRLFADNLVLARAAPPTRVMKSRRLTGSLRSPDRLLHRAPAVWNLGSAQETARNANASTPIPNVSCGSFSSD